MMTLFFSHKILFKLHLKQNKKTSDSEKLAEDVAGKVTFFIVYGKDLTKKSLGVTGQKMGRIRNPYFYLSNGFPFKEVASLNNEPSSDLKFPFLQKACGRSLKMNTERLSLFGFFEY